MFSAFWEVAYLRAFDGGNVLIPAIHPHMDMTVYLVLGMILSHGYVMWILTHSCSLSSLVSCLKGPDVEIPDSILNHLWITVDSGYQAHALISISGKYALIYLLTTPTFMVMVTSATKRRSP